MQTNDIAAIGLLALCGVLGLSGCFRGFPGLLVGLLIGCLVLGAVAVVSNQAWTGQAGLFFRDCAVTSYVERHISSVADHVGDSKNDEESRGIESWHAPGGR